MSMWKQHPLVKIGSLEAVDFPKPTGPTIVLCHGYGADCHDLVPLRDEMGLRDRARWVFPQAPKMVEIGPGFWGRAWFPIDLEAHDRALRTGEAVTYAERRPPGVNEARDQFLSFLKNLSVPVEQIILGGFSQGAMLALEAALTLPTAPMGVVLLSGTLADVAGLRTRAPLKKGLSYFQSHGESDQVLPFTGAQALHGELEKAGWQGVWCPFRGGHEIPASVLRDLRSYLLTKLNG